MNNSPNLLGRLSRAKQHVRKRTVLKRIRWGWAQHVRRKKMRQRSRRLMQWNETREWVDTRLEAGGKLRLYLDSKLSELIYCWNFEQPEREFLSVYLRPGDTFVDVGANIGLFSIIAGHLVGKTGQVYAFEPAGRAFGRLLENVKLNKLSNVSCHRLALSDQCGKAKMTTVTDGYDAWNSLGTPIDGEHFATETVETLTWDEFGFTHGLIGEVAMMKIDVEGWETRVLTGGAKYLGRPDAPVLQVEFTDDAARSAGSSCKELYNLLEEMGYTLCIYDAELRKVVYDPLRENYPSENLIATKDIDRLNTRLARSGLLAWWYS